ncbi:hypothetical protein, partial [Phormidium sp. CCY1219]|uniref:hypothetical protein n=1 Tax=Phormidium sp. CCY1219 TaxID=2886104 RepID=UPI002D1ED9FC
MLVFLMHGTSVRDVDYSQKMQGFIFNEFMQRGERSMPNFYPCFLGDIIGEDELWDSVLQDLALYQWEYPSIESDRIFSYQTFRQKLITQIFGDIFTENRRKAPGFIRGDISRATDPRSP